MNVSVRIIVAQAKDVVQVPIDAVSQDDEDNATVAVIGSDGKDVDAQGEARARQQQERRGRLTDSTPVSASPSRRAPQRRSRDGRVTPARA